jgi:hypothetical protein
MVAEDRRNGRPQGMVNASINKASGRFEVRATAADHFAWLRTRLTVERTLNRTAQMN